MVFCYNLCVSSTNSIRSNYLLHILTRGCSTSLSSTKTAVFVSTSSDVFTNLAWEHWWYDRADFRRDDRVLLFYLNNPCVVIGRHQNPWIECSLKNASLSDIRVARRQSGGGTVYHDKGNINCCFITHRKDYNRKCNLDLLASVINKHWDVGIVVNERDDLVIDNLYKVSGTAAKLGKNIAYHHCTLLVNSKIDAISSLLHPERLGWFCNATASVPSPVTCLVNRDYNISNQLIMTEVAKAYMGTNYIAKELLEYVQPIEKNFSGLEKIKEDLSSWEWVYGMTPKFHIQKHFKFPGSSELRTLQLNIVKGKINDVVISGGNFSHLEVEILAVLDSCKFQENSVREKLKLLLERTNIEDRPLVKILGNIIMDVMNSL